MRSVVVSSRIQQLLKMSSLGVLGALIAGCSSGFQRFDASYLEDAATSQTTQNAYPGGVDATTTASVNRRLVPVNPVTPNPVPQAVYHHAPEPTLVAGNQVQPIRTPVVQEPSYQQPAYNSPQVQQTGYQAPAYQEPAVTQPTHKPLLTYTPPQPDVQQVRNVAEKQIETVKSASLPEPMPITYTPPKPDSETVYIPPAQTDATKTASIAATPEREGGWTSAGGTSISVRKGETLYNLSKRYGVPVNAIRSANNMSEAEGLKAGQRIVIPNYIFSQNAAISAPDNNPGTRAASAGTGYIGEARNQNISVPTRRPNHYVSNMQAGTIDITQTPGLNSNIQVQQSQTVPQYTMQTMPVAENTGSYMVQSGDSLSKIAARHGTTVSELQRANNISGSNIRIGQKLTIPGRYDETITASVPVNKVMDVPPGVDPMVTGSLKNKDGNLAIADVKSDEKAPQRSGISQFRWPVRGRVVDEFGAPEKNGKNEGIDISVPEGTAVRAAENGVVIYTGNEISAYGNLVLVRHDDNWVSAYAHNRDFEVKKGDKVRRGQIIARSGKTGNADSPKLHFELRKESRAVNPRKYLAGA